MDRDRPIQMPNITQAQIFSALQFALGQLLIMGLVNDTQAALIAQIGNATISFAWIIGDAIIRHGRSRALQVPPRPPTEGESI